MLQREITGPNPSDSTSAKSRVEQPVIAVDEPLANDKRMTGERLLAALAASHT